MNNSETHSNSSINLEKGWKKLLEPQFHQPYFQELRSFLVEERKTMQVYPKGGHIFSAFTETPFENLKIILIGQDPYHGPGQAEGLSFSVPLGVKPPPSLVNMYKELQADVEFKAPSHGHLIHWAHQGILLLNSVLTVRANSPGSHRDKGWEKFTDKAIELSSQQKQHLVFLLWGKYAQAKEHLIDSSKHLILKAAHPSPFSAASGFFGCKHFSKANIYLQQNGIEPIQWQLPL